MRSPTTPVTFNRTTRADENVLMTSGRAGVVVPLGYIPLLPGDSASGKIGVDLMLAEMPKPLEVRVWANFQSWFVPKGAMPQFSGKDEIKHAMTGDVIKALGSVDRAPPPFFSTITGAPLTTAAASDFFKTMGIHIPTGATINTDLIDAFVTIYNFRLAAWSQRLTKRKFASEDIAEATALPPAFWPTWALQSVVPDYDAALIKGRLDLDVLAGSIPVKGIGLLSGGAYNVAAGRTLVDTVRPAGVSTRTNDIGSTQGNPLVEVNASNIPQVFAEMSGQSIPVTLADIDKARTTQAFVKLAAAYKSNKIHAYSNHDTVMALLMQGLDLGPDYDQRPWLLDSAKVDIGMLERHATDSANLDKSVTTGRASASLSVNVPRQETGGMIIYTVEVVPERLDERMNDEFFMCTAFDHLPNALRDIQRTEPVDMVFNRRVDAKHTTPAGLYGYEPMNAKWDRNFTRLGGSFYQATPGTPNTSQRSGIWQTNIVNPAYTSTHFLCPSPFPHSVFSLTNDSAFEAVVRHSVSIAGLTQIGDPLVEDNDEWEAVAANGV